ncbi:efflux RND transporter periplasmic adaptor subunit [Brevundimonas sp.]|uniref:efflux RND transporter periplasmic adaptor subunit n=2 Tax=Brevundimonas sp. TaxID=1871086 RepID=UPI002FCB35B1
MGAGAILLAGLLLVAFTRGGDSKVEAAPMTYTVSQGPFKIGQSFSGRIVPGEQVEIIAETDATVMDIAFRFGDRVEEGQILYRLSAADVWRKTAEARIGYLQAADTASQMENWASGPEMNGAKRGLESAGIQFEEVRRRHEEGQRLFERGLIARTEMEGLESSLRQSAQAVTTAQEDLARTEARGVGVERQVAGLQRGLASTKLQEAASGSEAVIRAPRAGVMVRPRSSSTGSDNSGAKVGGKVGLGQSLGVIAALDGLDVVFRVDEADLILLDTEMVATVTGPGLGGQTLKGHLLAISGEADAGSSGEKTLFEARVRLDPLSEDVARIMRIGMTAQVSLVLYETEQAISVPVSALNNGAPLVQVQKADGTLEIRPVTLGRIGPDRVEVLSGLSVGEKVVWKP